MILEKKITFECFLYENHFEVVMNDMDFCVNRIIMLPKIRPHKLEKAVCLSCEYCRIPDFRCKILEKSNECPVLIYKLHKRGVLSFEEIIPFLNDQDTFLLCYYFRNEIEDFVNFIKNKDKP